MKRKVTDKLYQLNTVQDFIDLADENNIDDLVNDFKAFLKIRMSFQGIVNSIAKAEKIPKNSVQMSAEFQWLDDGKKEHVVNLIGLKNSI